LLTDSDFRLRTINSLTEACHEQGFHLSAEELQAISLDDLLRIETIGRLLNNSIKRFSPKTIAQSAHELRSSGAPNN
jgi:hypothetical protein